MKYDYDAINILRGFKTVYIHDSKGELVYVKPLISQAFTKKYNEFMRLDSPSKKRSSSPKGSNSSNFIIKDDLRSRSQEKR